MGRYSGARVEEVGASVLGALDGGVLRETCGGMAIESSPSSLSDKAE